MCALAAQGRAFTQDDLDLDAAFAEFAAMALANSHAAVQMLQQRHLSDVQARILGVCVRRVFALCCAMFCCAALWSGVGVC